MNAFINVTDEIYAWLVNYWSRTQQLLLVEIVLIIFKVNEPRHCVLMALRLILELQIFLSPV